MGFAVSDRITKIKIIAALMIVTLLCNDNRWKIRIRALFTCCSPFPYHGFFPLSPLRYILKKKGRKNIVSASV